MTNGSGNYNYAATGVQQNKMFSAAGQPETQESKHLKSKSACV
jgi:hypothetical protein